MIAIRQLMRAGHHKARSVDFAETADRTDGKAVATTIHLTRDAPALDLSRLQPDQLEQLIGLLQLCQPITEEYRQIDASSIVVNTVESATEGQKQAEIVQKDASLNGPA